VKRTTVEERRAEILDVTCQVVIERGFAATRVADVANKLGVSTGLIHYHFESKDQLLAEAFARAAQGDLVRLRAEVAKATSAAAKLDEIFTLYSPKEAEPGWMLWIDGWGEALRSPTLRRISQELDVEWKQIMEDVIREGVDSGDFTCTDARVTAWRLAALLDGLAVQLTVHDDVLTGDELLDWVRQAASYELGIDPADFRVASAARTSAPEVA
jgi:AcrR family transcriptional regulator